MMAKYFNPDAVDWDVFLTSNQVGRGFVHFRGNAYQRGAGLGAIFRSVLKYLIPLGKRAGLALAEEGANTASRIVENLNKGDGVKKTLARESLRGIENVLTKAATAIAPQEGSGRKTRKTRVPPPALKKRKMDALGFY